MNHLEGALLWHDSGCSVIPIQANGTKKPMGVWKDYQTFRAPRRKVEQWFKTTPNWGVGLICGEVSGGLELLELEGKAMDSASLDKVNAAMERHDIIDLWTELTENGYAEITPSGGLHILYRIVDHEVPGNTKIANRPPTERELEASPKLRSVTLAETRGEGGFVIVAPTKGSVHPTGDSWSVTAGKIGQVGQISWAARCLLHRAIHEALDTMPPPPPRIEPARSTLPRSNPGDLAPGEDFNAKTSWSDLLNQYGWTYHSQYFGSAEELWTRPGKDPHDGHSASVGYQGSDNIYCWSSAADLPIEEPVSKFGFYTYMEHRGDFSASARALRAQGFGSKPTQGIDISDWFEAAEPQVTGGSDPSVDAPAGVVAEPVAEMTPKITQFTEKGIGRFAGQVNKDSVRYVDQERAWRVYSAGTWGRDRSREVYRLVEKVSDTLDATVKRIFDQAVQAQAQGDTDGKERVADAKALKTFAKGVASSRGIKAVTEMMSNYPGIAVSAHDFDDQKNLLCLNNGTFDLKGMELREHRPTDMLTKSIPVAYDPEAVASRWLRYLEEVIPDPAYRDYLQRAVGMALLGDTSESAFFVLWGDTGCGKSQFLEVMNAVFGDYGVTAAASAFRESRNGDDSRKANSLHQLRGARFVATSETSRKSSLDEELVKRVTGGDTVTSHALYETEISWKPEFTMFMGTNFKPVLDAGDGAIWRRVKPINFPNTFYRDSQPTEEREKGLSARIIDTELAGVFNWVLEGVRQYLAIGLKDPDSLTAVVKEYREESDPVLSFLVAAEDEGTIEVASELEISSTQAYAVYATWAKTNNQFPISTTRFGRRLEELGYKSRKGTNGVRMRIGFRLNPGTWQAEAQNHGGLFPRRQ